LRPDCRVAAGQGIQPHHLAFEHQAALVILLLRRGEQEHEGAFGRYHRDGRRGLAQGLRTRDIARRRQARPAALIIDDDDAGAAIGPIGIAGLPPQMTIGIAAGGRQDLDRIPPVEVLAQLQVIGDARHFALAERCTLLAGRAHEEQDSQRGGLNDSHGCLR